MGVPSCGFLLPSVSPCQAVALLRAVPGQPALLSHAAQCMLRPPSLSVRSEPDRTACRYAKNGWPITTTSNQGLGVQLKNLITQSADPIPGNKVGAGKLNVFQALQLVPLNPNAAGSAEPFGSSASSGSFGSVESFGEAEPVFEPAPPEEPGASNVAQIEANSTSPSPGGFGAASAGTAPQLPPIYIRAPPAIAAPAPAPAAPEVAAQLAEAAPAMPRRAGPAAAPSLSG